VAVGAIEPQFWRNLVGLLGLDEYADAQMDDDRQDEVRAALARVFATRTRDEWVAELGPADTCVSEVLTVAEAVDSEQVEARGLVVDAVSDTDGPFRQSAPVWAGTVPPDGPYRVRDGRVSDTAELLVSLGLDAARVDELTTSGAIA
jgi:alpha-methylacyl-CoA racemase